MAQNLENIEDNENKCDNNASPSVEDSCQFLKCNSKETESSHEPSISSATLINNAGCDLVNKHSTLKRTTNNASAIFSDKTDNCEGEEGVTCSSQIDTEIANNIIYTNNNNKCDGNSGKLFAEQGDDGTWMLKWQIEEQQENDFIALCWFGKFIPLLYYLCGGFQI